MELQPVFSVFHLPKAKFPCSYSLPRRICAYGEINGRSQRVGFNRGTKSSIACSGCWWAIKELPTVRLSEVPYETNSDLGKQLVSSRSDIGVVSARKKDGYDTSLGKPGSVSFHGLTHEMVEGSKFEYSPFEQGPDSFQWLVAPVVLISSIALPSIFVENIVNVLIKDVVLAEVVASLSSEAAFYMGFTSFLLITDRVQRPYLQVSTKSWGLITGLKGYLMSSFLVMALKIFLPLIAVCWAWPVAGLEVLVSVTPFLAGCLAQYVFEVSLKSTDAACWPLVPIIFEIYRIHQLTKASHYVERLMAGMFGQRAAPELIARKKALFGMVLTFQVLGLVCLWSLITFLVRLAPSKPVAEKY